MRRLLGRRAAAANMANWWESRRLVPVLAGLVALLLISNLFVLVELQRLRGLPDAVLARAADQVGRLRRDTFTYTLRVDQPIQVDADVPIRKTVSVPIETTLPVETSVSVPVNAPTGRFELSIPIRAQIPISLTAQVPLSESLRLDTILPIRAEVPITIRLDQTPLDAYLADLEQTLRGLR